MTNIINEGIRFILCFMVMVSGRCYYIPSDNHDHDHNLNNRRLKPRTDVMRSVFLRGRGGGSDSRRHLSNDRCTRIS